MSMPIMSLAPEPQTTGTITRSVSPLSPDLTEEDWRRARGALNVAMDPHGNGSPVNWDNPESGLKGAFSPVGTPFVKSDEICRAFLASLNNASEPRWFQGTACRPSGEDWSLRDIKPWKKVS